MSIASVEKKYKTSKSKSGKQSKTSGGKEGASSDTADAWVWNDFGLSGSLNMLAFDFCLRHPLAYWEQPRYRKDTFYYRSPANKTATTASSKKESLSKLSKKGFIA